MVSTTKYKPAYLYLLKHRTLDRIKIGWSANVPKRSKQLLTQVNFDGSIMLLCRDGVQAERLEKTLHSIVEQYRNPLAAAVPGRTEWFDEEARAIVLAYVDATRQFYKFGCFEPIPKARAITGAEKEALEKRLAAGRAIKESERSAQNEFSIDTAIAAIDQLATEGRIVGAGGNGLLIRGEYDLWMRENMERALTAKNFVGGVFSCYTDSPGLVVATLSPRLIGHSQSSITPRAAVQRLHTRLNSLAGA
ncbi:T5orf172 domain-containing protein [Paucimonas lemoignei]|uniref:T5orf172 domain-containing protein n=1 Tax=Paucimonas lemoignei TaxID=29443 RepID=A0A4R3HRQ8_PAULE|nr:GIY-YIG nuclease family protein [Paucimonas lemoignei]TCS32909.1 T5orf172 domain-containing protein [Paucimonas lemoignei]